MTMALDRTLRIGRLTIAAIVHRSTGCRGMDTVSFQISKRPIAILVHCDEAITIFEIDGSPIAAEDAKKRFPDLLATFQSQLSGSY